MKYPTSVRRSGKKTWGAMSTSLRRMVPSAYADGAKIPRGGWVSATSDCRMPLPNRLPNPRKISLAFHPHTSNEDDQVHTQSYNYTSRTSYMGHWHWVVKLVEIVSKIRVVDKMRD